MGNYNSCIYKTLKTATLLDPNGKTRKINLPITAAELMLENPGHVIAPADLIRHTRRISAIKADEQLSSGKLYLLVPPSRVHSIATSSDTALINSVAKNNLIINAVTKNKNCYRLITSSNSSKVSPVALTDGSELTCQRVSGQWKPVLEPIFEEPRGYVNYLTRVLR